VLGSSRKALVRSAEPFDHISSQALGAFAEEKWYDENCDEESSSLKGLVCESCRAIVSRLIGHAITWIGN
jgi:hypothetical protein